MADGATRSSEKDAANPTARRNRAVGTVVALAGGVLLAVGPFVRWVSVRADQQMLMRILHEGAHPVAPIVRGTTASITWLEAGGGAGAVLAIGIGVLVLAVIGPRRRWFPALIVGGGLVAGALTLSHIPDHRTFEEQAVLVASPWAFAVHVPPEAMRPAFSVDRGPSMVFCLAGAGLAVLGGAVLTIGPGTSPGDHGWIPWIDFHPAKEEA